MLSSFLRGSAALTQLNLLGNAFGDAGAAAVVAAFRAAGLRVIRTPHDDGRLTLKVGEHKEGARMLDLSALKIGSDAQPGETTPSWTSDAMG